jgi:hypothetical protein
MIEISCCNLNYEAKIRLFREKIVRMLADLKRIRTFAPLSEGSAS